MTCWLSGCEFLSQAAIILAVSMVAPSSESTVNRTGNTAHTAGGSVCWDWRAVAPGPVQYESIINLVELLVHPQQTLPPVVRTSAECIIVCTVFSFLASFSLFKRSLFGILTFRKIEKWYCALFPRFALACIFSVELRILKDLSAMQRLYPIWTIPKSYFSGQLSQQKRPGQSIRDFSRSPSEVDCFPMVFSRKSAR